jgi:hypothetical protein
MADLPPEWTFESTVLDPSGIQVRTVITVPAETAWASVQECGELAQMGASQTATRVLKVSREDPPF